MLFKLGTVFSISEVDAGKENLKLFFLEVTYAGFLPFIPLFSYIRFI
jgi:hypothetical protein